MVKIVLMSSPIANVRKKAPAGWGHPGSVATKVPFSYSMAFIVETIKVLR